MAAYSDSLSYGTLSDTGLSQCQSPQPLHHTQLAYHDSPYRNQIQRPIQARLPLRRNDIYGQDLMQQPYSGALSSPLSPHLPLHPNKVATYGNERRAPRPREPMRYARSPRSRHNHCHYYAPRSGPMPLGFGVLPLCCG